MSYWVEKGIQELEGWEQRIFTFLTERLPPEAISYYLAEYNCDAQGLYERAKKGEGVFTQSIYNAISSVAQIRSLLDEIKQPITESVLLEQAARFAVLTFRAGYSTGMVAPGRGVEVYEWEINRLQDQQQEVAKNAIRESSLNAHDARHKPLREFKEKAAVVAKREWESGSNRLHHQMVQYLIEEYEDEDGRHPFTHLPNEKKTSPEKVLLKTVKQVAKNMNRHDLISGNKKIL